MTIPITLATYGIASFLFVVASILIGIALTPPREESAEAKLIAISVFLICLGFLMGGSIRP